MKAESQKGIESPYYDALSPFIYLYLPTVYLAL